MDRKECHITHTFTVLYFFRKKIIGVIILFMQKCWGLILENPMTIVIIIGEKNEEIVLICLNCGAAAKFACEECGKHLCGRCISREKKDLVSKIVLPAGLCNGCSKNRIDRFSAGKINTLSESVTKYAEPIISGPKTNRDNQ